MGISPGINKCKLAICTTADDFELLCITIKTGSSRINCPYILFRTVKIIFPKRSLELFGRNKQADVESGSWNNKRVINWPMTRLWSSDIKRKGYLFTVKNGESLKLVQSLHKTKLLKSYIIDSYNSGKTAGTLFLLLVKILWPHKVVLFLGYWGILKAFPGKWAALTTKNIWIFRCDRKRRAR